jgi:ribosomal-protein-alanine N-acetyltransferase
VTIADGLTWPVRLSHNHVELRPIRYRDARAWADLRRRNEQWLREWESTSPPDAARRPLSYRQMVRRFNVQARSGEALPWVVTYDGELAGQLNVSNIVWGSGRMATVGYWVDERLAGRGIIPTALALAVDYCFGTVGLHRIEVNIRPENHASLRVVHKLGFREEGRRERYLHINGEWRDHLSFAMTADDVPGGLLRRWSESERSAT